jgi:hypothetical protein
MLFLPWLLVHAALVVEALVAVIYCACALALRADYNEDRSMQVITGKYWNT